MPIARMLVRSGLLTVALMSAVATAKAAAQLCGRYLPTLSLSGRDPSKYAVNLRRRLGAGPIRQSLVVREPARCCLLHHASLVVSLSLFGVRYSSVSRLATGPCHTPF
jgi:hypothetical protein